MFSARQFLHRMVEGVRSKSQIPPRLASAAKRFWMALGGMAVLSGAIALVLLVPQLLGELAPSDPPGGTPTPEPGLENRRDTASPTSTPADHSSPTVTPTPPDSEVSPDEIVAPVPSQRPNMRDSAEPVVADSAAGPAPPEQPLVVNPPAPTAAPTPPPQFPVFSFTSGQGPHYDVWASPDTVSPEVNAATVADPRCRQPSCWKVDYRAPADPSELYGIGIDHAVADYLRGDASFLCLELLAVGGIETFHFEVTDSSGADSYSIEIGPFPAGQWQTVAVPLTSLAKANLRAVVAFGIHFHNTHVGGTLLWERTFTSAACP